MERGHQQQQPPPPPSQQQLQHQHQQHQLQQQHQQQAHQYVAATRSYDSYIAEGDLPTSIDVVQSQKKKPPKLKNINRSISMAIDNYAPQYSGGTGGGGGALGDSTPQLMLDDSLIIEQPLIHRSASPVAARSAPPPQTLALPAQHQYHTHYSGGAVSPTLSARQQHQHHLQHLHSFQQLAAQTVAGSSSTSSPTLYAVSPVKNSQRDSQQPEIYLVTSSNLGDEYIGSRGRSTLGGSTSPIQFIDDMLQPAPTHRGLVQTSMHPLKKTMFRRSDTIDVHPSANFQMKKTHSFHVQQEPAGVDQIRLAGNVAQAGRRTSSVRGNFLMPGGPVGAGSKDISRSPSPSRRGARSYRSFNDPSRRPSIRPESVVESQIRHPSLNDDLLDPIDGRPTLLPQANLSLEDQIFLESRSRSNSHTKMENVGLDIPTAVHLMRKASSSFEENAAASTIHPSVTSSSLKQKRDHQHSRQQSSHSLELDGRPTKIAAHPTHTHAHTLHSAAAAATAAYHFKRGAQHGRSLYLSPNNLEELTVHRPGVIAAAAAFQGTNASANVKQAKALHSASMRLRTYRENLSASKKSKSFVSEGAAAYPTTSAITGVAPNEFELTSPHRRNSRPLSTAVPGSTDSIDEIKRSPRPLTTTTTAFIEEKRPSFERKNSLTFELSDAAFAAQVLRPFHHKLAVGRKESLSGSHKTTKKISISDEAEDDEDVDRKRKRIVCIVLTVFLCLVCAGVFVVIVALAHGQTVQHPQHNLHQHQGGKKTSHLGGSRDTPVHYTVRLENDRIKETLDRARYSKNITETASLVNSAAVSASASSSAAAAAVASSSQLTQQIP